MFLSLFNLLNFVFTILSEDTGFALAICAIAFTCFWIFPCYRRSPTPKQESQSGKALNVYAGSYTGFTKPRTLGWVGTPNPGAGITHFRLNASTAKLEPSGHVVAQDSPTWLEVSPRGDFLVATHELSHHTGVPTGTGFLSSYKINHHSGELTHVCTTPTNGHGNTCVTFSRTGRWLLVTRYWEGGVSALPFDPSNGKIGNVTSAPQHSGHGAHPLRQSSPHPHGIHGDPVTDMVYASDLGKDCVVQYTLDDASGILRPHSEVKLKAGSGPRGLCFHPSSRVAYVNCELDGTVVVCRIYDGQGLVPVQRMKVYPDDFNCADHPDNFGKADWWTSEAAVSRDGRFLVVVCRVAHSLAVFSVKKNGTLYTKPPKRVPLLPGSNARNLSFGPHGRYLFVASQDADALEVFTFAKSEEEGDDECVLTRVDSQTVHCCADVAAIERTSA